ncbi:MAG: hypothetical protein GQ474_05060 [Sulfurimonas sp.]|nr:hypothetical protein [Sulfurimonas sp.]
MKPLSKNDIPAFLKRFDDVKGGELVSLEMITPTDFKIALTAQDTNRGFDWVNLNFELLGVRDAKLLDDKALKAVDMEEGMNISFDEEGILVGFGSDQYLSSPLHLCATILKYEETSFNI